MHKNKVVVSYEEMEYVVDKQVVEGEEGVLEITSPYDVGLRLGKLLGDEWGWSRTKVKGTLKIINKKE